MNEKIEKEKPGQRIGNYRELERRADIKRMKSRKALGPGDIPVEVLRCLEERADIFDYRSLNAILESEEMPYSPRHFFPRNGEEASDAGEDVQSCSIYCGMKMMRRCWKELLKLD